MTTTRMTRCTHCNVVYAYHPSTYGFVAEYNDKEYCPECFEVITKALETVPVKIKKKHIVTTDYTREEIVSAQEKRISESSLPTRRLSMPLFDLKDSSNQHESVCESMEDPVSGSKIYYSASWWSKKPGKVEVKKEVWWDVKKNKPA